MLTELRIRDFAVVEDVTVPLEPGLNAVTGETGAGKSIVVGALHLLLGGRASAAVVRSGRPRAVVEGAATLTDYRNTDAEEMRVKLRAAFMACGDKEHPDWEEYDRAMVAQDAVIVVVQPERVYGLLR